MNEGKLRRALTGKLSRTLYRQMDEAGRLDAVIRENLAGLGYGE
jgi:type I restriction enzyme M protein